MSNESSPHTLETLEALPRKSDVVDIAASLGLDTEGTRAEITARILEAQAGVGNDSSSSGDGSGSESSSSSGESDSGSGSGDTEGSGSADTDTGSTDTGDTGEGAIVEVEDAVAIDAPAAVEAYTPPTPGPLCDTGKVALETVVASYFGVEEAVGEMAAIYEAVEAGKQPCVVVGTGNARFALKTFDELFDCDDVLRDVTEGVAVNLSRYLTDKNLFPRG